MADLVALIDAFVKARWRLMHVAGSTKTDFERAHAGKEYAAASLALAGPLRERGEPVRQGNVIFYLDEIGRPQTRPAQNGHGARARRMPA